MSRAIAVLLLGAGASLGSGCGRGPDPTPIPVASPAGASRAAPPNSAPRDFSWELRGVAGSFTKGAGDGLTRLDKNTLEIRDGRAFVNGKDSGPLNPGDAILVESDGRLFVNGEERPLK
jgi:hypothetical protein